MAREFSIESEKPMTEQPLITQIPKLAFSIREAAASLSLSERTVEEMAKRGEIPSFRQGRRVLVPVDGLRQWVKEATERDPVQVSARGTLGQ